MSELPYVFDVVYDVKTVTDLHRLLDEHRRFRNPVGGLLATMEEHGIPLPPQYIVNIQQAKFLQLNSNFEKYKGKKKMSKNCDKSHFPNLK